MLKRIPIPAVLSSVAALVVLVGSQHNPDWAPPAAVFLAVACAFVAWACALVLERADHTSTKLWSERCALDHARELGYAMRLEARLSALTKTRLLGPVVWVSLDQLERICRLSDVGHDFAGDTFVRARAAHRHQIRGYQDRNACVWPLPEPLPDVVAQELGEAHLDRSRAGFLP